MSKDYHEDDLKDGNILNNRSCTDILCIFVFTAFVIGWVVVIAVAFAKGDPLRIILPNNFRGETCGLDQLKNYSFYFVPLPSHYLYGICVAECPDVLDYVCNNDIEGKLGDEATLVMNTFYDHSSAQYLAGLIAVANCSKGSCAQSQQDAADRYVGLVLKSKQNKCFPTIYSSGASIYRCMPFGSDHQNATLVSQANATLQELNSLLGDLSIGSFFKRGFSEVSDAWLVILICTVAAAIIATVWLFLLRWILAPITYLVIVLVWLFLIALGYLAKRLADDYESVTLPGETGSNQQLILWRVIEYAAWIMAAMYLVVMLWLLHRVRIAIAIMKEASRAFLNNPGILLIPPVNLICILCTIAISVVTALYIMGIGDLSPTDFKNAAVSTFGAGAVNLTLSAAGASQALRDSLLNGTQYANSSDTFNASEFTTSEAIKAMNAYNFFMFLWVTNFFLCFGFFVMALVVCTWYFSATTMELDAYDDGREGGRVKSTSLGTLCRSWCATVRYHLGTIFFGSLLIAIVQFVRALLLYLEHNYLQKYKDNATIKLVIYCINYWLACIERVIKIISKNAFIICCIKSQSFLSSAAEALGILTENILRVSMLAYLSTATCWLIKCLIVGCTMLLAYFLIQEKSLTNDTKIESGLFPIFLILILAFIVASLFVNVYETCIDTILMCFFVDEKSMGSKFMPPSLSRLVGKFTEVAKAQKKYEEELKRVEAEAKDDPTPQPSARK
jgi:choline transporter-like protein 2/4/5